MSKYSSGDLIKRYFQVKMWKLSHKTVFYAPPFFFLAWQHCATKGTQKHEQKEKIANYTFPFSNWKLWLTSWHNQEKKNAANQIAALSHRQQQQQQQKSSTSNVKLHFLDILFIDVWPPPSSWNLDDQTPTSDRTWENAPKRLISSLLAKSWRRRRRRRLRWWKVYWVQILKVGDSKSFKKNFFLPPTANSKLWPRCKISAWSEAPVLFSLLQRHIFPPRCTFAFGLVGLRFPPHSLSLFMTSNNPLWLFFFKLIFFFLLIFKLQPKTGTLITIVSWKKRSNF